MNANKNRYGLAEIQLEQNRKRALKESAHFIGKSFKTDSLKQNRICSISK